MSSQHTAANPAAEAEDRDEDATYDAIPDVSDAEVQKAWPDDRSAQLVLNELRKHPEFFSSYHKQWVNLNEKQQAKTRQYYANLSVPARRALLEALVKTQRGEADEQEERAKNSSKDERYGVAIHVKITKPLLPPI
jgi:hypothetical protein